ncbi:MAG: hypothetical protein CL851_06025 [Crocinitomicaceae bacterium]|nr:hypothetical protein [Crocinitomicaceae bacterium]|tara:strand:- start:6678 stop:7121 length:444 start_codon:yes stop_codon:yes gene_type:complete
MPQKVFSVEDGNLNSVSVNTARSRSYKDIDLTFANRASGDVFKKTDAGAVKQAVRNLLLTNFSEKPFLPRYGGDLNSLLFSLNTEIDEIGLEERILESIEIFEPRAEVLGIQIRRNDDSNEILVTVKFKVISINEVVTTQISLTRLR